MVSTTSTRSRVVVTAKEAARAELFRWGALMITIYGVYLAVFPLSPTIDRHDRILEIELLLREGRTWFAPIYVLGLALLFLAYWRLTRVAHDLSREDPEAARALRIPVLGLGLLCGVVLLGLYPITALDVALYMVRARLWELYGGNPMLVAPASFPQDPYTGLAGEYDGEVSPYGPLWELIAQAPIQLGIWEIGGGVIAMKVISLISYAVMGILVGWYARQDTSKLGVSRLTALTFFALNPMLLMQAIGNGHNDMVMLALLTLGLVLWQRDRWPWAAFALTLATLVKVTALIFIPLFGIAVLAAAPSWRARAVRGFWIAAIFLLTSILAYRLMGPLPDVFEGARHAMFGRAGYTPSYALKRIVYEINPDSRTLQSGIANAARGIFILYFAWLMIQLARGKITLIPAGFLAYFGQLLLGATFRIWYPMWLIPFAALGLNSRTYWRTFLFSLTAELSILMYLILWRWKLDTWAWALTGPLKPYWHYWTVMTLITAPWVFGIPLLGPMILRWRNRRRFDRTLLL
jgi:hypothetical protein